MTPIYHIKIPESNIDAWAKLENQNPTGTHKDRSMARWISSYAAEGVRELAISSSGNSAISAAKYCDERNIKLYVFVSPSAPKEKFARLKGYKNIVLAVTKTPNRDAFRLCKERGISNLRASKDDAALEGYNDIALELIEQLPRTDNIFIPTSSGATLQGIHQGYVRGSTPHIKVPALFAVQTTKVHPIADYFDKAFTDENSSRATAIVDRVAHRKDRVVEIVRETEGGGFVISNNELEEAQNILSGTVLDEIGVHSVLAFAGFLKWREQNSQVSKQQTSVCLFTD